MSDLARPINRTLPNNRSGGKTRVLLLRQPIKSVRREDEGSVAGFRLALCALVGVGAIGLVWLLGYAGFRLGFVEMLGLPTMRDVPGAGLSTGARMLIGMPLRVFEAGVAEPMLLMSAFALLLVPAGGLAAARPQVRGGPRPSTLYVVSSWTGAIVALLVAGLILFYVVSPYRSAWIQPFPSSDAEVSEAWLNNWRLVAGLDVLVMLSSGLWTVLVFRLMVPAWMKALASSLSVFALVVILVAMSMTNGTVVQLDATRSVVTVATTDADGATDAPARSVVLLGSTRTHVVVMDDAPDEPISVWLIEQTGTLGVTGRRSITDVLESRIPDDTFF